MKKIHQDKKKFVKHFTPKFGANISNDLFKDMKTIFGK
jgi:hypothetical protein